ncbi:hypothetical protein Mapa_002426 [Marchantia paleacea]|nr:hypothetical protein Mapa_002426 [Marchantia paleacea]
MLLLCVFTGFRTYNWYQSGSVAEPLRSLASRVRVWSSKCQELWSQFNALVARRPVTYCKRGCGLIKINGCPI